MEDPVKKVFVEKLRKTEEEKYEKQPTGLKLLVDMFQTGVTSRDDTEIYRFGVKMGIIHQFTQNVEYMYPDLHEFIIDFMSEYNITSKYYSEFKKLGSAIMVDIILTHMDLKFTEKDKILMKENKEQLENMGMNTDIEMLNVVL